MRMHYVLLLGNILTVKARSGRFHRARPAVTQCATARCYKS